MKIDWTIRLIDVIFIIMFITAGYFAMTYDVASHNEAVRKCELLYKYGFNVSNITVPLDINLTNPN